MSPFDFITSINSKGKNEDLMEGEGCSEESYNPNSKSKSYVPFIINRSFSYFNDTLLIAELLNRNSSLPKRMQYDLYRHLVRKGKRFGKWAKPEKDTDDLKAVKAYYGCSSEKAQSIIKLLKKDELLEIKKQLHKGGKSK